MCSQRNTVPTFNGCVVRGVVPDDLIYTVDDAPK
jgi:hypothetical protein